MAPLGTSVDKMAKSKEQVGEMITETTCDDSTDTGFGKPVTISDEEIRVKAHTVCRDYLHGAWKMIAPGDMTLRPITGGLSNLLFYCELPESQPPLGEEPPQVLLRMYGQVRDGAHDSTITESVIFTLLAERKLGPKLYGIFPGGRLEEFIQASPLSCTELRVPAISEQVALRMVQVHNLKVPISKEPVFLWQTMKKWSQLSHRCLSDKTLASHVAKADIIRALRRCNFEHEMDWLKQYFSRFPSPVLFCHNDCQEGNILKHNEEIWPGSMALKLTLIDFEYCSYNYRGFDIANHFCEWMYDYSLAEYPHFTDSPENWPSQEQQLRFIRAYLSARDVSPEATPTDPNRSSGDLTPDSPLSRDLSQRSHHEEQQMLDEAAVYCLASHLFWTLWSVVNAPVQTIPFGYWEYGLCRLNAYERTKQQLLARDRKSDKTAQNSAPPTQDIM